MSGSARVAAVSRGGVGPTPRFAAASAIARLSVIGAACAAVTACGAAPGSSRAIAAECSANLKGLSAPGGATLKALCPQAQKICILSDYLSLDDYIKEGALTRPADYDPGSCDIYTHRNGDAKNEIIAIPAKGCPFFLDDSRRVFGDKEEFMGDCFEPSAHRIARDARGYKIFRLGGKP